MKNYRNILNFLVISVFSFGFLACSKDSDEIVNESSFEKSNVGQLGTRSTSEDNRRVMLYYGAGFNSLAGDLFQDIKDFDNGYIPSGLRSDNVLLVYAKLPEATGRYNVAREGFLIRIYRDMKEQIVRDTIYTTPSSVYASDASTLRNVLTYVKDNFPAKSYGLVISSHGTGWLPTGYYANPSYYDSFGNRRITALSNTLAPYVEVEQDPTKPRVKTFGQDVVKWDGQSFSKEIEIQDFASAFPMHLDYILFDACLMGNIEVAYELKDVCDYIGFAPTEVLTDGFNYNTMTTHLLKGTKSDPKGVCIDYFEQYNSRSGDWRSASITLMNTANIDNLANVTASMINKYRNKIDSLDIYRVQPYFREYKHWYYDFSDIFEVAGASADDMRLLNDALDKCIEYKATTPSFLELNIYKYSGISMFLPSNGSLYLKNYYKKLGWNKVTGLVE